MPFEKAWPKTFVQSCELNKENIIRAGKHVSKIKTFIGSLRFAIPFSLCCGWNKKSFENQMFYQIPVSNCSVDTLNPVLQGVLP